MALELAKAMRGHAQRQVNAGVTPRDPVAAGLRLNEPEPFPRLLVALVIVCAVVFIAGVLWEIAQVPPAHLLIIAFVIGSVFFRFRPRRR
jgi:hypothetical protein